MNRTTRGTVIAASASPRAVQRQGRVRGIGRRRTSAHDGKKDAKVACTGVNECKGQGECAGTGNSCAGSNSCKGKGVTMMSADDCQKKGGKVAARTDGERGGSRPVSPRDESADGTHEATMSTRSARPRISASASAPHRTLLDAARERHARRLARGDLENFMAIAGGRPLHVLSACGATSRWCCTASRCRSAAATSSTRHYLRELPRLADRFEPAWVSTTCAGRATTRTSCTTCCRCPGRRSCCALAPRIARAGRSSDDGSCSRTSRRTSPSRAR